MLHSSTSFDVVFSAILCGARCSSRTMSPSDTASQILRTLRPFPVNCSRPMPPPVDPPRGATWWYALNRTCLLRFRIVVHYRIRVLPMCCALTSWADDSSGLLTLAYVGSFGCHLFGFARHGRGFFYCGRFWQLQLHFRGEFLILVVHHLDPKWATAPFMDLGLFMSTTSHHFNPVNSTYHCLWWALIQSVDRRWGWLGFLLFEAEKTDLFVYFVLDFDPSFGSFLIGWGVTSHCTLQGSLASFVCCKTLLKLTIPRIKLLRNRKEIQLKQMCKDIAKLLENGQEATARIRVEHIIREENMMAAQDIIELFSELIAVRLPIIETQRECPLDLKEAISSICFAAPRCSELPELQQVQMLFAAKYGKEFVAAASELMPDCGVNRQLIELLSARAPPVEARLKLMKEIAEEHDLDWDPAASESEFFKPHEDLLNGPNNFSSASTLPLYKGKHDDSSFQESDEESDTQTDLHSLDLLEVPKVSVRASSDTPSDLDHNLTKFSNPTLPYLYTPHNASKGIKQDVPFVSSEPAISASSPIKQSDQATYFSQNKSEADLDLRSVPSFSPSSSENEASISSPSVPTDSFSAKQTEPAPSSSHSKSDTNLDIQDVLAAAHAAADNAERAAATARAAASLAEVRISELVAESNNKSPEGSEHKFQREHSPEMNLTEGPTFDQQNSFAHINQVSDYEPAQNAESWTLSSDDLLKMVAKSPNFVDEAPRHQFSHQLERSTSLEDDSFFSYPSLFASKDKSGSNSFSDNSP